MKKLYLLTGASGHLGSVLLKTLLDKKCNVKTLILSGEEKYLPSNVDYVIGDVCDKESLKAFFDNKGYDKISLIHCAGIVSISSKLNPLVWKVNVEGTRNILECALENKIDRVIYVSSVHALPELDYPQVIKETRDLSNDRIIGQYGKSKAEATNLCFEYADKGLNISIVHPSGIIGPGDIRKNNNSVNSLKAMFTGKIPIAISGGYDFVDVRDVALGILQCEEKGLSNENYILSNHYLSIEEMLKICNDIKGKRTSKIKVPYKLVKVVAPIVEWFTDNIIKSKPLITPYSMYTLNSNSNFSHEKATKQFDYKTRDIKETIKDTVYENI